MSNPNGIPPARWNDYVLFQEDGLRAFWSSRLREPTRKVLFILGKGFDPRMCIGLDSIMQACSVERCDVSALIFDEEPDSASQQHRSFADQNWSEFQKMVAGGKLSMPIIPTWSEDSRKRVTSQRAASVFNSREDLMAYTDIVVDISAMPRGVYFPLIGKLLYLLDAIRSSGVVARPSLHVMVAESPSLDRCIRDEGPDEAADYLFGFQGGWQIQGENEFPMIWIPLLGEGQSAQIERISELVGRAEICPVLPSPSVDPRRGDNLILEYQRLLFDVLRVEPRNFIFASEWNPFEVYRQVRRTVVHYSAALQPLGGCKIALSALSTKLMSLGALLVAYELKAADIGIGVAHVESQGYVMTEEAALVPRGEVKLHSLWLHGECYE